jgi:hypothetical protein
MTLLHEERLRSLWNANETRKAAVAAAGAKVSLIQR